MLGEPHLFDKQASARLATSSARTRSSDSEALPHHPTREVDGDEDERHVVTEAIPQLATDLVPADAWERDLEDDERRPNGFGERDRLVARAGFVARAPDALEWCDNQRPRSSSPSTTSTGIPPPSSLRTTSSPPQGSRAVKAFAYCEDCGTNGRNLQDESSGIRVWPAVVHGPTLRSKQPSTCPP
jgi:hypothetical protein